MSKTYRVEGRWPFPTDMLRFDDSEPATPEDAALVELLTPDAVWGASKDGCDLRQVYSIQLRLRHPVRGGLPAFSEERWPSFGWRVT